MTSDPLLEALGATLREQTPTERDVLYTRLTEGVLPPEEQEEIRQQSESDPAAQLAYDAHRPLDAQARDRIFDRISVKLSAPPAPDNVVHLRPRWWKAVLPSLAAAAAVVFFVALGTTDPLPGYQLSVRGTRTMRGSPPPAEVIRARPGSQLHLVARPATAVTGATLKAWAFFWSSEGLRRRPETVEVSKTGSARVTLTLDATADVDLRVGVVIGHSGSLPTEDELQRALGAGHRNGRGWMVALHPIETR